MRTFGRYRDINGITYFQRVCTVTGRVWSELPVHIEETITMRTIFSIPFLPIIRTTRKYPALLLVISEVYRHSAQLITSDKEAV